jgi:hypothetical protein
MGTRTEKTAYQRGYTAGKARRKIENEREFWQKAMLTVLPHFMESNSWTSRGEKVTDLPSRVRLAAEAADGALEQALKRGKT